MVCVTTLERGNEKKINQGALPTGPPLKGKIKKNKGLSISGETHHAETDVDVPGVRPVPVAVGSAKGPRVEVPGAAAQNRRPGIILVNTLPLVSIVLLRILGAAPFPGIPRSVMEPKGIRLERCDRRRLFAIPLAAAANTVGSVAAKLVAPPVLGLGSSPRYVLPLRLCG